MDLQTAKRISYGIMITLVIIATILSRVPYNFGGGALERGLLGAGVGGVVYGLCYLYFKTQHGININDKE